MKIKSHPRAQGTSVTGDWDYELPEVYFVAIMNFKFDNSHPDHYILDVRLIEINTNEEFYPKLSYIFIEMPKFRKTEGELVNELDEWLYILNNMKYLDGILVSLQGKPEYEKLFEMAEVGNLTPTEMNEYQQSLKIKRDNYSAMKTAKDEGLEIGKTEERAKAEEEKRELAIKMLTDNVPIDQTAKYTKLTIEEIEVLV